MFDFVGKFHYYPDKLMHFIRGEYDQTLATVLLYIGSGVCNNDCIYCDKNFYEIKPFFFSREFLDQLIEDMVALDADSLIILGEGAEPLLCPSLSSLIENATNHDIVCGLYTNGSIVNDTIIGALNKLDFLRVSLDAGSLKTHQTIHRYSPELPLFSNAIKLLKNMDRTRVNTGVSYIVLDENAGEIFQTWKLLNEIGVAFFELKLPLQDGYVFKTIDTSLIGVIREQLDQIYTCHDSNTSVVLNNHLKMLLTEDDLNANTLTIQDTMPCYTNVFRTIVSPLGYFLCSPRKNTAEVKYGDPASERLKEAWCGCRRKQLIGNLCAIRCTYCKQNLFLQNIRQGLEMPLPKGAENTQRHFL